MQTNPASNNASAAFGITLLLGVSLSPLNTTMISVALTPITKDLNLTTSQGLLLVVAFYIFGAVFQPLMGTLGNLFDPRRIYLLSLTLSGMCSIAPLLFPQFGVLLITRVLLGIGTAAAYPCALIMMHDQSLRDGQLVPTKMLTRLSIASMSTAAAGPVVGGVLIDSFGWTSIFTVNVPLALIAILLGTKYLPTSTKSNPKSFIRHIDLLGLCLFALVINFFVVILLVPVFQNWLLFVAFFVVFVVFIIHSLFRSNTYIDLKEAVLGPIGGVYLRLFLSFIGPYALVYAVVPWTQADLGASASFAGYIQIPYAIIAGASSLIVGRTFAVRAPLLIVALMTIAGGIVLASLQWGSSIWLILIAGLCLGVPHGVATVTNQLVIFKSASRERLGNAAGLSRSVVALTAIAVSGVLGLAFSSGMTREGISLIGASVLLAGILNLWITLRSARDL